MDSSKAVTDSSSGRSGTSGSASDVENSTSGSHSPIPENGQYRPVPQTISRPPYASEHGHAFEKKPPCVELFVGDLSFFCNEHHLVELFSPFGKIIETVISRSDTGGHSLLHGFIKMANMKDAETAADKLNDQQFMGRMLR